MLQDLANIPLKRGHGPRSRRSNWWAQRSSAEVIHSARLLGELSQVLQLAADYRLSGCDVGVGVRLLLARVTRNSLNWSFLTHTDSLMLLYRVEEEGIE